MSRGCRELLLSLLLATIMLTGGAPAGAAGSSVTVTLVDFKIRLSTDAVPPGTVKFHVINRGNVAHGFTIAKPTSFGTDASGRVYVASATGSLYRLDLAPPRSSAVAATAT